MSANGGGLTQKTRENLSTAKHGEGFAYAKYSLYAKQALQTGNAELAKLFTNLCVGVAESEYMMAETRGSGSAIGYLQTKNRLQTFSNLTGGLAWFPRFEGEIPSLFGSVVGFLRVEYDLGFLPSSAARDAKSHKLNVEIVGSDGRPLRVTDTTGKRRKVVVYAREGYIAAK